MDADVTARAVWRALVSVYGEQAARERFPESARRGDWAAECIRTRATQAPTRGGLRLVWSRDGTVSEPFLKRFGGRNLGKAPTS